MGPGRLVLVVGAVVPPHMVVQRQEQRNKRLSRNFLRTLPQRSARRERHHGGGVALWRLVEELGESREGLEDARRIQAGAERSGCLVDDA